MSNHSISEDDEGDGASAAAVPAEKRQASARLATVVSAATVVAAQTQHMALDAAARSASATVGNGRAATGWARRSGGAVAASPRNETPPVSVEPRSESDGQRGASAQAVAGSGNGAAGGTN